MATFLSYIILFSLHFQKFVGFLERSHSECLHDKEMEENPHSLALCSPCVWKTVCVFS